MARSNPPRILFLTLYPATAASPRYRVAQFVPYLEAHGFDCTVAAPLSDDEYAVLAGPNRTVRPLFYHLKETRRRIAQILQARRYDIVFLQKALMTAYLRGLPALLRRRARRLVLDIDDAVHLAPPHPLRGVWRALEDRAQVRTLFAGADLTLAGNEWLQSEAADAGANAVYFPTVVDTDRFTPAAGPAAPGYRIGWIGNPSTTPHLADAAPALARIENAEIRLVGADPRRSPVPGAEVVPWALDTEVAELQSFDAGIMPLPAADWNRGKCALKALQYLACGAPCVASPFGAVCGIIRNDENGLLADSDEAWTRALEQVRDPAERRRLGEQGRATVEDRFALDKAAPRMRELLESLL